MAAQERAISAATAMLYCDLMEEIKRRVRVAQQAIDGEIELPRIVAIELCFLQFRLICELIALACLTAHGDVPGAKAKRLTKEYNADTIMKSLEALHPAFYPEPGEQVLDQQGRPLAIDKVTSPHLTKSELQKLYGVCGNFLHRGSLANLLKSKKTPTDSHLNEWILKITTLLNHHQIQLADPNWQLWVIMQSKDDGKVHAAQMLKGLAP